MRNGKRVTRFEAMFCMLQPFLRRIYVLLSRIKVKYACLAFVLVATLDFFGVFTHLFESSYDERFSYPYEGDVREFVLQLRNGEKPDLPPINEYNYSFIDDLAKKCDDAEYKNLRMVLLVKSAVEHFERRIGIRNSWGFERRFYDVPVRTVFLVGRHPGELEVETRLKAEAARYGDIVRMDFLDTYFNNTVKTMMGFKWAVKHCPNSKFYMFVDDDMYVSLKNVLAFVRHPTAYPDYLKKRNDRYAPPEPSMKENERLRRATVGEKLARGKEPEGTSHDGNKYLREYGVPPESNVRANLSSRIRNRRQIFDFELPEDVRLFAGFVFVSAPHRHRTSKWYVSLAEYPYHMWPPYVTAGAYVLSKEALVDMYYSSLYTKHFRFDDVYLGLVAKKAEIEPFHCDNFHFYKENYTKFNYKYVVASHGYGDPDELVRVWNEQKGMGHA